MQEATREEECDEELMNAKAARPDWMVDSEDASEDNSEDASEDNAVERADRKIQRIYQSSCLLEDDGEIIMESAAVLGRILFQTCIHCWVPTMLIVPAPLLHA
ncbi:hypothetical protein ACLB2K_030174 [Fragaria x ananassa]